MAKANKITIITPVGVAMWPKLDKPDTFMPKKGEPKVRYMVNVAFEPDDLAWMKKEIAKAEKTLGVVNPKNSPFKVNKKDNSETLVATSGADYKPAIFDAKNRRLPDGVVVGGGSKIRLDVTVNAYDGFGGGVNLYINSVQVLDLKEPTWGVSRFEAAEGFEYSGEDESSSAASAGEKKELDDEIPF